ncbi:MAG: glycogen/starch/alpha-glucan phosphorylase [Candidatus Zapsychrus exili]|nr:glycogen/starch/alpha-glucan phosphorylase [Candidatus Zapsychrus exili]
MIRPKDDSSSIGDFHKGFAIEDLKNSFKHNLLYPLAKDKYSSTDYDKYLALAITVRDRIVERWIKTQQTYHKTNVKRAYYLSMEFLIGRLLGNYVYNLGLQDVLPDALSELGHSLEDLREQELDAGLGNGGLGRLAACFLDSMATLEIPAHGYGIRYDYGIFKQKIVNGYQIELPDEWLRLGCPWEFPRPEYTVTINFYGKIDKKKDKYNKTRSTWLDTEKVLAVPYDVPIPGYKNDVVNTLRLWSARSTEEFDLEYFNHGDYEQAVYQKIFSENISKVLYPNDSQNAGRELRLKQEYFFTAASIADIIRRFRADNLDFADLPKKAVMQLNDTHPSLGIIEMMRVLIDDFDIKWEKAWKITQKLFAYTNHTLMPEALECWSIELLGKVLPRHLELIYEINNWFLDRVKEKFPKDKDRLKRMSIIGEGEENFVRMASLSVVGSFSVNGVSALHTELIKSRLFKDFDEFYPGKINNKTNGITQRRWLLKSNPLLSSLITSRIGDGWITNRDELGKLLDYKDDSQFKDSWNQVKFDNKIYLANYIKETSGLLVDPNSMFDVQIKRIHEYKRQMLFALYIIREYLKIKSDPGKFIQPRTCLIGGKSAPGYAMAKLIIKFINNIAATINKDKDTDGKLKVLFMENYRVSLAEKMFPASDLSEQISTAGTEASGTGNMKFMLNGALTVGTLDGANVEMAELLGFDEIFIFGLKDNEVQDLKSSGYNPSEYIDKSAELKEIYKMIKSDFFSKDEKGIFRSILESIFHKDNYLVCADFDSYCAMQDIASLKFQDKHDWARRSIANVARSGKFSSDRTIREYSHDIWGIECK